MFHSFDKDCANKNRRWHNACDKHILENIESYKLYPFILSKLSSDPSKETLHKCMTEASLGNNNTNFHITFLCGPIIILFDIKGVRDLFINKKEASKLLKFSIFFQVLF